MSPALSLATRALRGFLWNGSASVIQLGTMLALYHLLPLDKLGHFEWALAIVMLLALIGDLGLGSALVQLKSASDEHFDAAFWANLIWGLLITGLIFSAAPTLANLLGGQDPTTFAHVLRGFCLLIPFASVSGLFRARLQRNLDFSAIALSELVSVLTFGLAITSLFFLHPTLGVLIPVIGSVCREAGLLISLALSARWRPRGRFNLQALRELLAFALNFTGSRTVAYVNTKIAYIFIFGPLGPAAQAYYSLAERLTLQPLTRLATTIQRVSFPTFSSIQNDNTQLRSGYLRSVQGLILAMGPVIAGVFVFAPEIASLLNKTPMLPVLRLLAAATMLKIVGTMVGSMFMAKGKANWSFYWSIFSLCVLIPAMYFYGLPRGVAGVAEVVAASSLLFLLLSQHLANRLIDLPFTTYLAALVRPALVVACVFALLFFARPLLPGPPLAVLSAGSAVGVVATLAAFGLIANDLCRTYWKSVRGR